MEPLHTVRWLQFMEKVLLGKRNVSTVVSSSRTLHGQARRTHWLYFRGERHLVLLYSFSSFTVAPPHTVVSRKGDHHTGRGEQADGGHAGPEGPAEHKCLEDWMFSRGLHEDAQASSDQSSCKQNDQSVWSASNPIFLFLPLSLYVITYTIPDIECHWC